jgi:hypothetical protein
MNQRNMSKWDSRPHERGGARLKFIVFVVIVVAVAYSGYLYIPVQFDAYRVKDLMQGEVDRATALGYPVTRIAEDLKKKLPEYNVPADAIITPSQQQNRFYLRVQYTRPIEFPGYTYNFEFDHTAQSTDFLTVK